MVALHPIFFFFNLPPKIKIFTLIPKQNRILLGIKIICADFDVVIILKHSMSWILAYYLSGHMNLCIKAHNESHNFFSKLVYCIYESNEVCRLFMCLNQPITHPFACKLVIEDQNYIKIEGSLPDIWCTSILPPYWLPCKPEQRIFLASHCRFFY
jgi:hypothetical protein